MLNRKEIVDGLVVEGMTYETLATLTDNQILQLGSKLLSEAVPPYTFTFERASTEKIQYDCQMAHKACMDKVASSLETIASKQEAAANVSESKEVVVNGIKNVDTDNVGNPDVTIKKGSGKKIKLINDREEIDSDVVEEWMIGVVNKNIGDLTKSKLIEMVKGAQQEGREDTPGGNPDYFYDEDSIFAQIKRKNQEVKSTPQEKTKLFSSIEQEYAFEQLNKYVLDLDGYEIKVDELNFNEDPEEAVLNLYLDSKSGVVWDIVIYTDGGVYMDGAPIEDSQDLEEEIREKESGSELRETEMPVKTPVRTPTKAPTRPGKKRGPFERPKTTPKPKAENGEMPDWFGFDDIKSQIENS